MPSLPDDTDSFLRLIRNRLFQHPPEKFNFNTNGDLRRISAVLFLLGKAHRGGEPFIILNKRSRYVRQPGDLCCPGGGISPPFDFLLTHGLSLPVTPLARWPHMRWWRHSRPADYSKLSLLLAAALREGFEEMRLNPFGVTFLGPMPAQDLVMFKRSIYPMVAWVNRQQRFAPNWEVEKIVRIPIRELFNPANYARYRISYKPTAPGADQLSDREMPCFVHHGNQGEELLWGATYRITEHFFKTAFGFTPPPTERLPVINRRLDRTYLQGSTLL